MDQPGGPNRCLFKPVRQITKSHVEEQQLNDFVPCRSDCSRYEIPSPATVTPTSGSRERTMFRHLRASMAVVGLLTMAVAPADAGAKTGTWKYWNPSLAQAAPPYWH